jgi:hypothetical protein
MEERGLAFVGLASSLFAIPVAWSAGVAGVGFSSPAAKSVLNKQQ